MLLQCNKTDLDLIYNDFKRCLTDYKLKQNSRKTNINIVINSVAK